MTRARAAVVALALALALATALPACARPPAPLAPPATGAAGPPRYDSPSAWLCLPGREDACARDLDATDLAADGSRAIVRDTPAPGRDAVDCFYVYPTVDLSLAPGNHEDFTDVRFMTLATVAQVARLRAACSLYVPLYRQVTIGTYLRGPETKKPYTDVAFSDVLDAFRTYMAKWNAGRKIVLVGHSQGAEMIVMLLQKLFDGDAAMRDRLLLAMPIGWAMDVPRGQTVGGTFANLPVCTAPGQTSCVVGYRSFWSGAEPTAKWGAPPAGHESICVNPAELAHGPAPDGGPRAFTRTFLYSPPGRPGRVRGAEDRTTPFLLLRGYYAGRCVETKGGYRYLAISETRAAGDTRAPPIDLDARRFRGDLGLHVLDLQLPQGDLVDLVAERAAALAPR